MPRLCHVPLRLSVLATAVVPALLVAAPAPAPAVPVAPAAAAPLSAYELPFTCGEVWTGATRSSHSPSIKAIDFNRPDDRGAAVLAAAAGVVITAKASDGGGYGRMVVIDHGNNESTLYAHLESVAVVAGQAVGRGVVVGAVGDSGHATGPHLHFEERSAGTVVDAWFHAAPYAVGTPVTSQNCPTATPPGPIPPLPPIPPTPPVTPASSKKVPLAADFVGNPASELVVFERRAKAAFKVQREAKDPRVVRFGARTDQPLVGDWDGDGRANPGVRTASSQTFQLKTRRTVTRIRLGRPDDLPLAGDWDGDGTWEVGVRRATRGIFKLRASDKSRTTVRLGDSDDLPVTGDWDGDGRTDLAVYDQATAVFTVRRTDASGASWTEQLAFGVPGDLPVAGDWDGNRVTELGVWNPATAVLSQRQ